MDLAGVIDSVAKVLMGDAQGGGRRTAGGMGQAQEENVLVSITSPPLGEGLDEDQRIMEMRRKQRESAAMARRQQQERQPEQAAGAPGSDLLATAEQRRKKHLQEALRAKQLAEEEEQQAVLAARQREFHQRLQTGFAQHLPPGMGGPGVGFGSMSQGSGGDERERPPPRRHEPVAEAMALGQQQQRRAGLKKEAEVVDLGDEREEGDKKLSARASAPAQPFWKAIFKGPAPAPGPATNERRISGFKRTLLGSRASGPDVFDAVDDDEAQLQRALEESRRHPQPSHHPPSQPPPLPLPPSPPPPPQQRKRDTIGPIPPSSMSAAMAATSRGARPKSSGGGGGASPSTGGGGGHGGMGKGPRRIPILDVDEEKEEGEGEEGERAKKRPRGKKEEGVKKFFQPRIGPPRPPPESPGAGAGAGAAASASQEVIELSGDEGGSSSGDESLPLFPPKKRKETKQPPRRTSRTVDVSPVKTAGAGAAAPMEMATVDLSSSSRGAGGMAGLLLALDDDDDDELAILQPGTGGRPSGGGLRRGAGRREPTDEEVEAMVRFESCLSFMLQQAAELSDPLMAHQQQQHAAAQAQAQPQQQPPESAPKFFQFSSEEALKDVALRLLKDELLSDEILNRALDLLAHLPQARDCVLFNTFWYEKLRDGRYAEAEQWLRRALRGKERGRLRLVLVPVNVSNAHWVLVFVDLDRATVQEWDPASAECMLDPSRVKNVKDAVEKHLGDVLRERHGPGFTGLRRCDPPRGLPQQSDAINCGLFVVLFSIHLVFLQPAPETLPHFPVPLAAAAASSSAVVETSPQLRKSRRLEEAAASGKANNGAVPGAVPVCCFKHGEEDLYKYRLMLLAWILHSQTSQLPRTDLTLLGFVRAPVAVEADDLGCATKLSKRRLLVALLRDDAPFSDRADLLRAGMRLLQRQGAQRAQQGQKQQVVAFLPPAWFDKARQGNLRDAFYMLEKAMAEAPDMEQCCAPCLLPPGPQRGCLLARISLQAGELPTMYLHGSHALAHVEDAVEPHLQAALRNAFDGREFAVRHVVAPRVPEARMDEVAALLMAMQAAHRGSACRESAELFLGGEGPDLARADRFFAARVGLIRWFLRHTSWVG